ncbi:ecdysteroid UDP-glucosyltransferase [Elysia marginata]|uniref:Ecdysteroid UDP-glucosyltransferase n=1 Tax=Elysia marginata TaxID=1093978 RepID=A0AAV4HV21_9GAST|nr:ecdysteroid UDP-glucosyltransferase [Elysia marginata]
MLGMGEGGRRRGRSCMRWKDDIKTVTGLTLSELVRAVENRDYWRQLITTITRSRPGLDGTSSTWTNGHKKEHKKSALVSIHLLNAWPDRLTLLHDS